MIVALLALGVATAYAGFASFAKPRKVPVGNNPLNIAAGDFDQDGDRDLAVSNFAPPSSITILKNRGRGRLKATQTIPTGLLQPDDIAVAPHLDAGKDPDLVVGGFTVGIATLRGTTGVRFAPPKQISDSNKPRQIAVGDFNRDGLTDIAADRQATAEVAVYLALKGGGFAPPDIYPGGSGQDISAARIDGDNRLDLVVPNPFDGVVRVYLGRRNGTFKQPVASTAGADPASAASGDFNRDGKRDLAVANPNPTQEAGIGRIAILLGRGNGKFKPPRQFKAVPFGEGRETIAVADFDRDGREDLAFPFAQKGKIVIVRGKRGARFGARHLRGVGDFPTEVLTGRLNRDRRPDIAATTSDPSGPGAGHVVVRLKK